MSLQSGKVPANMKLAKVVPIYKAKEKTDLANYRPISLLPSTSKILEKIVHCRLYKYLMKHELLSQNQFGFRPKHSTTDAIATLYAHLATSNANKLTTVQITFIFIGQTRLVFGKCVCTCVTKHSNAFRTFLNWLKNSKRVWHEPKLHISRLPLFANFDL